MNILVTGSAGFVGRNLVEALKNIRDGKDKTRPTLSIGEIYEYDLKTPAEKLDEYCRKTDFVFYLAGVNRPQDPKEFMEGNFGFSSALLDTLKKQGFFFHRSEYSIGSRTNLGRPTASAKEDKEKILNNKYIRREVV